MGGGEPERYIKNRRGKKSSPTNKKGNRGGRWVFHKNLRGQRVYGVNQWVPIRSLILQGGTAGGGERMNLFG